MEGAMTFEWKKPESARAWACVALAALFAIVGVTLFIGGLYLAVLGGSWYYFVAGAGLIASAVFLAQRRLLGAWIYAGLFLFTLFWALWEVGLDGWALVPRLLGPWVLLLLVILCLPALDHARGRRRALLGGGGWLALSLVGGIAIAQANSADPAGPAPAPLAGMSDPSLLEVGADWPAYGGTYAARRYSPLSQITRDNVEELERAWLYRTGDLPEENWGAETTPINRRHALSLLGAQHSHRARRGHWSGALAPRPASFG
jgi:quinoprotein glucose dehydrogenase